MEKYKDRHSHIPTYITHYRLFLPLSPSRSSVSHSQKWFLVFLLQLWPSLAYLHTQQSKSPEMIWPHQGARVIHSTSVGLFCIPYSQLDWIFHLHARLLPNVTHTSLKQHCHSLLASSVFPYSHLLFCLEQGFERPKTSKRISSLLFSIQLGRK